MALRAIYFMSIILGDPVTREGQDVAASSGDSRGRSAASEGVRSCARARAAARAAGGARPCTRCCWEISGKV